MDERPFGMTPEPGPEGPWTPPTESGPPDSGPPAPRGRGLAPLAWFFILLAVVGQILLIPMLTAEEADPADGDPIGEVMLRLQGRYLVGAASVVQNGPLLYAQADAFNTGPVTLRQRFVVLAGELAGPASARAELDVLNDLIADEEGRTKDDEKPFRLDEDDRRVQEALDRLYPPTDEDDGEVVAAVDALTEADRQVLRERLGWFGDLALVPASSADQQARSAVLAPAQRTFAMLIGSAMAGGVGLVAGLAGLIVMLVLAFTGRLRSGVERGRGHHGAYAETFAIWLFAFVILQIAAGIVALAIPDFTMLCAFVAFMLSLVCLAWPVIRGIPWSDVRADIGLTAGRSPVGEPFLGLASYLMTLPILGAGVIVTYIFLIIDTMTAEAGPTFAPAGGPAHPIVAELGSGNALLVLQVLLVASVAAPIVEETMFRGVLYRHLRDASRRLGFAVSVILSTLVNAFVFAIIHPQGWVAVPALMGLAVGFTLAREWRGTLVPSMVMHAVSNGLVLTLLVVLVSS
jgi:membrane protease YdiL (CAAX protease family)